MSLAAPAANLAKDYSCVESSSDPDVWPAPLPKLVGSGNGDKVWGVCGVGTFRGQLAKDYSCVESSSRSQVVDLVYINNLNSVETCRGLLASILLVLLSFV